MSGDLSISCPSVYPADNHPSFLINADISESNNHNCVVDVSVVANPLFPCCDNVISPALLLPIPDSTDHNNISDIRVGNVIITDTNNPLISVRDDVILAKSRQIMPSGILVPTRLSPASIGAHDAIPQSAPTISAHTIPTRDSKLLKFLCWNVRGLSDFKIDQHHVLLQQYDFICLTEVWSSEFSEFSLEGYESYNFPRKKIHENARRPSGGIYLFINRTLLKGIDVAFRKREWIVWCKLSKDFFNFKYDLYVASIYIPPIDSNHAIDEPFSIIESDITSLPPDGDILLLGDHNARTGGLTDFALSHDTNAAPFNYPSVRLRDDIATEALHGSGRIHRVSRDRISNAYGRDLISLCHGTSLLIMNGRVPGNSDVAFTCECNSKGNSTVDYFVGSASLLPDCVSLKVHPKFPESDHRPLSLSLKCDVRMVNDNSSAIESGWVETFKYKYSKGDLEQFPAALTSAEAQPLLGRCFDQMSSLDASVDSMADAFTKFTTFAIEMIARKTVPKPTRPRKHAWFDKRVKLCVAR